MKNRWIPILILALLLFCLCGCGAAAVNIGYDKIVHMIDSFHRYHTVSVMDSDCRMKCYNIKTKCIDKTESVR